LGTFAKDISVLWWTVKAHDMNWRENEKEGSVDVQRDLM
jgi:hypothetical protein